MTNSYLLCDRIISIAKAVRLHTFDWGPHFMLIGNVCAEDIADLCDAVLALAQSEPESECGPEEVDMVEPSFLATSDDILPVPLTEHDLIQQWNNQADEFNQWDSLDTCEQLAWAQVRAIAADRNRRSTLQKLIQQDLDKVNRVLTFQKQKEGKPSSPPSPL